jgi:predicted transcriptional regulator
MEAMDRKQKEALVIALSENGKTYREITKEAGVSPNTIKAILNNAGLDHTTSISSRVFELYSQNKTPLDVAITLGSSLKKHYVIIKNTFCFSDATNLQRFIFRSRITLGRT